MSTNNQKRGSMGIYILSVIVVLVLAYLFLGVAPKERELPTQKPLQESNHSVASVKQIKPKIEQNNTVVTEANITKEQNTTKIATKIITPKKEVHIEDDIELTRFEAQVYAQNTKRSYQKILGEDFPLHVKAIEDGWWAVVARPNEEYDTAKIMQQLQDNAIEVE